MARRPGAGGRDGRPLRGRVRHRRGPAGAALAEPPDRLRVGRGEPRALSRAPRRLPPPDAVPRRPPHRRPAARRRAPERRRPRGDRRHRGGHLRGLRPPHGGHEGEARPRRLGSLAPRGPVRRDPRPRRRGDRPRRSPPSVLTRRSHPEGSQMPRTRTRTSPLLAATLSAGLALAGCGRSPHATQPPATPPTAAGRAPAGPEASSPSHLVEPERVRYAPRVAASGTLKASHASALAMSVPGTLLSVAVRRGEEVRAGALLASLDDGAAAAAAKQGEAAVAAAQAQLALAEDAFGRVARIREQEGASEAQAFQARAQRDLARAQLAAAGAQLDQARVNLAHHHLRAPFAGVVTRVPDGVGITVAPGGPLVTLVSTRQLVLETSLTQEEAAEVRAGAKVLVVVPATGARCADATVSVVVPAVDVATNRVPVEVTVDRR